MSRTKVQLVSDIVGNVSGGASFTGIVTASSFSGDGANLTGVSGGGIGTAIKYADNTNSPFSFIDADITITSNLDLNTTNAGASNSYIVSVVPNVTVASGVAVTVGTGKTMVIDALQIGDL